MKSLVEYIEEQMLLEYAGVFNGADEIAEDIYKLILDNKNNIPTNNFTTLEYNVTNYINDKFNKIIVRVYKLRSKLNDIGGECKLPDFKRKTVILEFKFCI